MQAWVLGIESHPDFVDRSPEGSSKIVWEEHYNSTGICCFVPTEAEGEDEQEEGEGIVTDSPLESLAPLYEDLIENDFNIFAWEVHGGEFRPKKKDRKGGRKRKARGEGWGERGGGYQLGRGGGGDAGGGG